MWETHSLYEMGGTPGCGFNRLPLAEWRGMVAPPWEYGCSQSPYGVKLASPMLSVGTIQKALSYPS